MRPSWFAVFGALVCSLALSPAHADPAYKADTVINLFGPTLKAGAKKQVCFGDNAANCGAAAQTPAPAPAKFDLLVTFDFNSDKLTPAARENLAEFAKALIDPRLKGAKFEIDGHTDATGGEDYNMGLSERRAESVVAYLVTLGVDRSTLTPRGWGKTKPRVADPYSPENRRVDTHVIE